MLKQFALAVALSAVVIIVGLSAKSRAFSDQDASVSFDDRWAAVTEAVRVGKVRGALDRHETEPTIPLHSIAHWARNAKSGGRGRTRTGTPVTQKQILSLLCLPFHHAACGAF